MVPFAKALLDVLIASSLEDKTLLAQSGLQPLFLLGYS